MRTLRQLMDCADVDADGSVSVLFDYFGFARGRVPVDPDSDVTASVSVLERATSIDGDHFHLNVIRVGFDVLSNADQREALEKLDYSIYRSLNIYRTRAIGIGRIQHFSIDDADSNGRGDLGSESEADDLSDEWSVDNDGIDAFVVRNISDSDFVGISPVKGSCSKGAKNDGLVAGEIGRGIEFVARTFSHEIGHYLGLKHNHSSSCPTTDAAQRNLMAQTRCVPMIAGTNTRDARNGVRLTGSQGTKMRDHCSMTEGC